MLHSPGPRVYTGQEVCPIVDGLLGVAVKIKFQRIGETKGTFKYQEVDTDAEKVGIIYIKRATFPSGAPRFLMVTIEPVAEK